ncbi:hypothetical protein AT15_00520 [Kosmotoga arenicorallina S304]|uniref:PBS lyase n=1 Tax=Kosmotoga arenicorallina S304 TaxID=1453497 RepID=A0A176K0F7_9BACT|nr:HEAT repeat domain-containing protein [Kosmotoga arenicorallina]OAA30031.1 hypothetical protein AT15_00520 [Kosmotoga arenicorallina S304]
MTKDIKKVLDSIQSEIEGREEYNVKEMLQSPSAFIRSKAIKELSASNISVDRQQLESFLEDPSYSVRKAAVELLGKRGIDDELLVSMLDDPNETVRSTAVKYLTELGLLTEELTEKISKDPSSKVRKALVEGLIDQGAELEELKAFENDPGNDIREILKVFMGQVPLEETELLLLPKRLQKIALASAVKVKDTRAMNLLVEKVKTFNTPTLKAIAIEYLGTFPEEIAKDTLMNFVKSDDKTVSIAAVKTYGKAFGYGSELLPYAESFVRDPDEEKRIIGAQILKRLMEPSTVDLLRENLNDPSDRVRSVIIEALGNMLDYSLEEVVDRSLASTSTRLKKAALRATKKLKLTSVESGVVNILGSIKEENSLRILAVSVAGYLKYESAIPQLARIIQTPEASGKLRLAAARALARIAPQQLLELFGIS